MKFNCSYGELLSIDDPRIVPNPKNPNKHPDNQIERLAKIIDYQGQRSPIVISKRSGFITKGHGRLMAIKKLGWKQVAVDFQDYENEAQEWADIVADNAIAEWSELDKTILIDSLNEIEIFDLELLGVEHMETLKEIIFEEGDIDDQGKLDQKQMTKCPNCGENFDHAKHKA